MRKLVILFCIALSSCSSQSEPTISLKEVEFPDLEFSKFIAENGIRRQEGKELSPKLDAKSTVKYDSMGRIIFTSYGSFMPDMKDFIYDSNGLMSAKSDGAARFIIRFEPKTEGQLLKESILWIREQSDTVLAALKLHLLDNRNIVIVTAECHQTYETARYNNLTVSLFFYNDAHQVALSKVYRLQYPSLKSVADGKACKTITRYFYTASKPDSSVSRSYYTRSKTISARRSHKAKRVFDDRGVIARTIFDDTLIVGYQHFTY